MENTARKSLERQQKGMDTTLAIDVLDASAKAIGEGNFALGAFYMGALRVLLAEMGAQEPPKPQPKSEEDRLFAELMATIFVG